MDEEKSSAQLCPYRVMAFAGNHRNREWEIGASPNVSCSQGRDNLAISSSVFRIVQNI
jgi:hypothetical protein